jgi:hypothetical protein
MRSIGPGQAGSMAIVADGPATLQETKPAYALYGGDTHAVRFE